MPVRFATTEEISHWNDLIIANPDGGNVFSSFEYAQQKKLGEYKVHFLMIDSLAVTVLEKSPKPFGKIWYLPKGPNVTSTKSLLMALEKLHPFAKKLGVFVVRIESELPRSEQKNLEKNGLLRAAPIIPNPSTITLDISPSVEEILTNLPQKGRHAIRRAERDGVTAGPVEASEKNCKIMYRLLSETAEGQFGIRSYNYYKTFWQRFSESGLGQLFFAEYEGTVVAGAFAMTYGKKSTYKDGASIRKRTAYGASHLLQWRVIEWAKSNGVLIHDFCGSPPSDEIDNPDHPHHGIGLFKRSFSKNVVDFIGCYDLVLRPAAYKAWIKIGERLHRRAYHKRTKDYYY